jgi:type II secretion system-associated lipoprotein
MKKIYAALFPFFAIALLVCGCAFLQKKDRVTLQEMGKGEYVMLADVVVNPASNAVLHKGDTVTLKIVTGTEWVKVYGFNASLPPLEAPQVLILYMYSNDFKDEIFSMSEFETAFGRLLAKKTGAESLSPSKGKR